MRMDKITSFTIFLASCWVLGGATVTQTGQLFANLGINDVMFTDNITIESTATNAGQCALQCNQQDTCVTFTFRQNTCRGHGTPMSLYSTSYSAPGARSFAQNSYITSTGICEGTGVQRLTNTTIGLDKDVYCDNGWLVFQKRQDGSVDFNRNWDNYINGFGDVNGEYWLGLDPLHHITWTPTSYELRVDLMSFNGTKASVVYSNFTVGPAADNYRLNYDSFLGGTTGDSLSDLLGMQFSTPGADHDKKPDMNCAERWKASWWYKSCGWARLNGIYKTSRIHGFDGILWHAFDGWYSLKSCQMMIRPAVN